MSKDKKFTKFSQKFCMLFILGVCHDMIKGEKNEDTLCAYRYSKDGDDVDTEFLY